MESSTWKTVKEKFGEVFELDDAERTLRLADADPEVRREVEKLLAANDRSNDFIDRPFAVERGMAEPPEDQNVGTSIDEYRIVSEIGAGGMGKVYLAEQAGDGFSQRVALKLIKRGMDTSVVLKRFLMERQILARLEHPNIARMLDGGSTESGLPYFVMEYVDGMPIRRYCEEHGLGINERLELFQKVCSAVSYAHQNLVVHRDLKPSNILINKEGQPKLLDFGIAKLLGPDWGADTAEATATQFRVMTPEYASPEQIEGKPATTTTDVYSLGVVLYELLAGTRPFMPASREPSEIAKAVLSSEPQKPSSAISRRTSQNPGPTEGGEGVVGQRMIDPRALAGDLDNIVMKALRREPERRYQSVAEFSADIRRFLGGLPVTATADSRRYRFQKFYRRHRAGVLGAAAAATVLISATAVTGWQYTVAERERATAERRFEQVRELARNVIFGYYDGIAQLTGSMEIRKKMVEDATQYLDSLAVERSNDPDLMREVADAYQRIGDVQGNVFQSSNMGEVTAAHESYLRSHAIWSELYSAAPDEPRNLLGIRRSYLKLGEILWSLGRYDEAKTNIDKSLELTHLLDEKGIPQDRKAVFDVYNRSSQVREQLWDLDGALEVQNTVIAMAEEDLRKDPESIPSQKAYASVLARAGDILYRKELFVEAGEFYSRAVPTLRGISDRDRSNRTNRANVALILGRHGTAACEAGDFNACRVSNEEAIAILLELEAGDPGDADTKMNIATISGNLARSFCGLGDAAKCVSLYQDVLGRFERLVENSDYAYGKGNFATAMVDFADLLVELGRKQEAGAYYERALRILSSQDESSLDDAELARVYYGLGEAAGVGPEGRSKATEHYQRSLAHLQKVEAAGRMSARSAKLLETVKSKVASSG
ncbi:MAG: protein kinase [Pyrinomonadaceae bacterium]|nr:protein kinase [Pyrinomonadaceae bacterium]